MMLLHILLAISLAAKCSSMSPTYPNITKVVQTSYLQKLRGKGHQPSIRSNSEPMSTAKPCSETTDPDEIDPFSNGLIQFAPLPFKLKHKKMLRLCTKVTTPKSTVAFEYEGGEEVESAEPPPKKFKLEPYMETYRGPKVYNHFIPGQNIRAYPYWNNYDVADSKLVKEDEKLENIFRQYVNYENESKKKLVPKLAIFDVASHYTPDHERLEMDIAETTSQAPPQPPATRPKLRHMNIIRDFKSSRASDNFFRQYMKDNIENEWKRNHMPKLALSNAASLYIPDHERLEMDIAETTSQAPPQPPATRPKLRHMNIIRDFKSSRVSHVAPAAGLLRMVAHPAGNFKLGKKELSLLRNKYLHRM